MRLVPSLDVGPAQPLLARELPEELAPLAMFPPAFLLAGHLPSLRLDHEDGAATGFQQNVRGR